MTVVGKEVSFIAAVFPRYYPFIAEVVGRPAPALDQNRVDDNLTETNMAPFIPFRVILVIE